MSQSIDDVAFPSGRTALYVTDSHANAVWVVTGNGGDGQAIVAASLADATNPPATGTTTYMGSLDLSSGTVTPISALVTIEPSGFFQQSGSDR